MRFNIFPNSRYTLIINLPKNEVHQHLKERIQLSLYNRFYNNERSKELTGTVTMDVYKVKVKTNHRNNLKPEITLKLKEIDGIQTKLTVDFTLKPEVKLFLMIWILLVLILTISYGVQSFEDVLFSGVMIVFAIVLTFLGYHSGYEKSTKVLIRILRELP